MEAADSNKDDDSGKLKYLQAFVITSIERSNSVT